MADFDRAFAFAARHEGLYSNDPSDNGGPTKYGVSLYLMQHCGEVSLADVNHDGRVDILDIQALTPELAKAIYKELWWDKYRYDNIESSIIAAKIFDIAINVGGVPCHKLAQKAALACGQHCSADGIFGPISFNAICAVDSDCWMYNFKKLCISHYTQLAIDNPKLGKYLNGWINRVKDDRI